MTAADIETASKSNEPLPLPLPLRVNMSSTSPAPTSSRESPFSKYLAKATSIYKSSRTTHPRYQARIYSLSAIAVGSLFNFLTFIAALFEHDENAPIVVAFWVGVVVSIIFLLFSLFLSFPFLPLLQKKRGEGKKNKKAQEPFLRIMYCFILKRY